MSESLSHIDLFLSTVAASIERGIFQKLSLGNYQGKEQGLKNIYVKPVHIKRQPQLSFTYRYKTRDVTKNYEPLVGLNLVKELLNSDFKIATLFTSETAVQFEVLQSGKQVIRNLRSAADTSVKISHNKEKNRVIQATGQHYLQGLNITDQTGAVFQNAQDKFKQINRFVEVVAPLLKDLGADQIREVADMGSGKGYLTFGLYDYLHNVLKWDTRVTGVEYRDDLVTLSNEIAKNSGFKDLTFVQGTIQDFDAAHIDVLIALHACDTATDDAILKGISARSQLIIVAPCCHKQVRKEMEASKEKNELSMLTRHGVFLERQAEMVTDAIRALYLEYAGYKTKVFEFISDAHTPKNVMIIGTRNTKMRTEKERAVIAVKIAELKGYFGVNKHPLDQVVVQSA